MRESVHQASVLSKGILANQMSYRLYAVTTQLLVIKLGNSRVETRTFPACFNAKSERSAERG